MTTVPASGSYNYEAVPSNPIRASLAVDNGIPGGGASNMDSLEITIRSTRDGSMADSATRQYVQDLLDEAIAAINNKIDTDYPLLATYSPSFRLDSRVDY